MRIGSIAIILAVLASPAGAQEISPEVDKGLWCATAIYLLDEMGIYPPEADDAQALTDFWGDPAMIELDMDGLSDEAIETVVSSYVDELSMQLPDYLASSDPEALRLDLNACFVTVP